MARYVTVAALGPEPPVDAPADLDSAVERMLDFWTERLEQVLPDRPDLVVLPECCDRYPTYEPDQLKEYYLKLGDRLRDHLAEVATKNDCLVAYSSVRHIEDDTWTNSTQLIGRDGSIVGAYHKNHPTIGEIRDRGIRPGVDQPVFETDLGRIAFAICFDLNFDDLRLAYARQRPDLLAFSSVYHGGLMQRYWAYSCRCHFVGAVSNLPCQVINPVGHEVATSTNYHKYVVSRVNLDCAVVHLDDNWPKLNRMKRELGREVSVFDPGLLAPVLVSSETDQLDVEELIRRYDLEKLDDYLVRAQAVRDEALD